MDYKEKLEEAKRLYQTANADQKYVLESLFPQLKESEDEKIRKAIIESLPKYGYLPQTSIKVEDAIAWLEKQGEQSIFNVPIREIILAIWDLGNEWKELTNGCISTEYGTQLDYIQKHWQESEYYLKAKQGERKFFDYENANIQQKDFAPKVEPKFKVGDWIANDYCMGKVIALTDDAYLLDTGQGIPFSCEHNVHLWTIADAKDGDVLCTYECDEPKIVFILKGMPKKPYILSYHCYYNIMYPHFETDSKKGCLAPNDEDVKPATKEQRDTLKEAMTDAGYTFDYEKKELKKIEQKPVWSEEDEKMYLSIMSVLLSTIGTDKTSFTVTREMDWLKSLKERVQSLSQPKGWSEEDKRMHQYVVNDLRFIKELANDPRYVINVQLNEKEIEWMESLKGRAQPQNRWKPSDDEMEALAWALSLAKNCGEECAFDLGTLQDQLKKLREE